MPNIAHASLTDPELHETIGAAAATINQVHVSDGAGGTSWQKVAPNNLEGVVANGTSGQYVVSDGAGGFRIENTDHGSTSFVDTAAPYAFAATTSFANLVPTTTPSGHAEEFTENTNGTITYTGAHTEHVGCSATISLDQSTGSNKDISLVFALNGTAIPLTTQITTATSALKQTLSIYSDLQLTTNDIISVQCKISSAATVNVYCYNLVVEKF